MVLLSEVEKWSSAMLFFLIKPVVLVTPQIFLHEWPYSQFSQLGNLNTNNVYLVKQCLVCLWSVSVVSVVSFWCVCGQFPTELGLM